MLHLGRGKLQICISHYDRPVISDSGIEKVIDQNSGRFAGAEKQDGFHTAGKLARKTLSKGVKKRLNKGFFTINLQPGRAANIF
jgi:hypothetical protein